MRPNFLNRNFRSMWWGLLALFLLFVAVGSALAFFEPWDVLVGALVVAIIGALLWGGDQMIRGRFPKYDEDDMGEDER